MSKIEKTPDWKKKGAAVGTFLGSLLVAYTGLTGVIDVKDNAMNKLDEIKWNVEKIRDESQSRDSAINQRLEANIKRLDSLTIAISIEQQIEEKYRKRQMEYMSKNSVKKFEEKLAAYYSE